MGTPEDEIAWLRKENARLRAENEELRLRVVASQRGACEPVASPGAFDPEAVAQEVAAAREKLRDLGEGDSQLIIAMHDELVSVRSQCMIYAEALEESRQNLISMKQLYAELNEHLSATADTAEAVATDPHTPTAPESVPSAVEPM